MTKKKLTFFRQLLVVILLITATTPNAKAHTAFRAGEVLQYSLYYNWKFIWMKAGSATMTITGSTYNGVPSLRTRLIMRGSKKADNYFILRDTLQSHVQADNLRPLHYAKYDIEGSSRRKREVWYTYPDNRCRALQRYTHKDGRVSVKDETKSLQIHDMLSIMLRARTYNTSDWKPGKRIIFSMTDGNGVMSQTLIYRGKQKIKIRGHEDSYQCLKLSFVETNSKGHEKEVITFFVTDDANHIPVRLDMYLKFGSAKAYLTGFRGLANPMGYKGQ